MSQACVINPAYSNVSTEWSWNNSLPHKADSSCSTVVVPPSVQVNVPLVYGLNVFYPGLLPMQEKIYYFGDSVGSNSLKHMQILLALYFYMANHSIRSSGSTFYSKSQVCVPNLVGSNMNALWLWNNSLLHKAGCIFFHRIS